jgi:hypothetical protein
MAPTASCQPHTVSLDANGMASIVGTDIDNGSSDNCSIATYAASPNTFDCGDLGANSVTLTVTDGSGNTADCNTQVTVVDALAPVALCQDVTVQLDASGNASIVASEIDNGSSDNCVTVSLQVAPTSFTCQNLGSNTVTLTVTDGSGNSSDCTANVTIEDNVAPTAICKDLTVSLDPNGLATITSNDIGANSSDNCGVTSLSVSVSSFGCGDVGPNTVTLTVTDGSNNTASCTSLVTVEDNLPPTVLCQATTVELDANGNASLAVSDVDAGSTDNCGVQSSSISPATYDCNDLGTQTVTLTVTDVNGNSADCTSNVEVQDNIAPDAVCQDITVQLDANGLVNLVGSDFDGGSSDNCGITSISVGPSSFDCSTSGNVTVFVFVSDASQNQSSCTANVKIEDTTNPTAGCQPITVQLDVTGNASIVASDVEGGSSDNCFITTSLVSPNLFDCNDVGQQNTVTLTVFDLAGNSDACTANVTVEDNVPPTPICQDVTVNLDPNGQASIAASQVDNGSTDACGVLSIAVVPSTFDCSSVSQTTAVLTVTDVNGNTASCQANVFVNDQVPPVAVCQDFTVQLDATGNAAISGSDIDNGSSDACSVTSLDVSPSAFTCTNTGANPVTLTVTDVNGNTANCTATVTVEDLLPPTMVCQSIAIDLDANGFASIAVSDVDGGTTDNCGIGSSSVSPNTFDCSNVNSNTVTLTITDVNGNSASCSANVTVSDPVPPTALCQDITVQLDPNGNASIVASQIDNGSSDACGVSNVSVAPTAFSCQSVGANTVTLTVTDVNNNSSTCTATVTVEDQVAPVASCQDITVSLDANGLASIVGSDIDNGSSDACGISGLSASPSDFDCQDVGPNIVTLTVTDVNNNTSSCTATVTVEDNVAPIASCTDITIQLDASGQAAIAASDVDNGSTDVCGIASLDVSPSTFDCGDLGGNTVTLTVTDVNNNTASCTAIVTVEDVTPPTALCQDLTIQLDANGQASISASAIDNGSSDVCSPVSLAVSPSTFGCNEIGQNTVTLTVTDGSQNASSCTSTVTVEDLIPPVAICKDITVQLNTNSMLTIAGSDVDNGSNDNCAVASLSVSPNTFDCSNNGANTVILTVTDTQGNTASCSATVNINETIPTANNASFTVCNEVQLNIDLQAIVNSTGNGATANFTWFAQNAPDVGGESTSPVSGSFINDSLFLLIPQVIRTVRYVVTPLSSPGNCPGSSFFVDVLILPNPDVSISVSNAGGSTDVCSGDQRSLVGILSTSPYSPPLPHVYTWSIISETGTAVGQLNGTAGPVNGPNTGFSGTGVGTVSVELALQDNVGCIGRDTVVFTILQGPDPMIVGADSVCAGALEGYKVLNPSASSSYQWTLFGGGSFSAPNLQDSISVTWGNINGSYNLLLREVDSVGCFAFDTLTVLVAPNLVLNPIANLPLACPGDTLGPISLTTVPSSPNTQFSWTVTGANFLGLSDGADTASVGVIPAFVAKNPVLTVQNNFVQVTANLNGCTAASQSFSFSVNIGPLLGTPDTARICIGDSYDLSTVTVVDTNGFTDPITYHTGLPATAANQLVNTVVSPTVTTTYYIKKNSSCPAVLPFDVNVSQPVTPTFNNPQLVVCEKTTGVTYTLNQTFNRYDWSVAQGSISAGGGTTDNFVTVDFGVVDDTIKVVGTDLAGCSDSTEIYIDVIAPPVATITGLDSMYCPNDGAVTLTGSPLPSGGGTLGTFSISAPGTITDNGNGTASFDPSLQGVTTGTGIFYITYTYDDGTNCTASITARVQIKDDTAPTALCKSASVVLDANGLGSLAASDVDNGSSDDCASTVSLSVNPSTFDCQNLGQNTVTLTVDDGFGNQSSCSATVTVTETTAPTALCQDVTVQLDANGSVTVAGSDVDGGSSDNCGPLTLGVSPSTFDCSHVGQQQVVTLTIFDPSLNISSCTANVTVEDNLTPTASCQDIQVVLDANGDASIAASDVDDNSSDNCGIASYSVSPNTFDCSDLGANNSVVLTVTDVNGLSAACTATVTVQDTTPPVITCPQDINEMLTQNCDSAITWTAPVVTDNCGIDTVMSNWASGSTFSTGTTTVIYEAFDDAGNRAICSFTVTLTEGGAPTALCQDVTVQLDATGNFSMPAASVDAGSSDNCSPVSLTVTRTPGQGHGATAAFDCNDISAPVVVELLVADSSGNTATCTAQVTVQDVTPPTANCVGGLTINLDPQGMATIAVSDVDNGSSDACGITSSSIDKTSFTTADIGNPSVVTLTVTDASGNSATCTTIVTIGDNTPPVAVCVSQLTVYLDANGQASITASDVDAGSSDDTGIASLAVAPNTFDCNDLGSGVNVTLTVTDLGGNQDACQTLVTVLDTIAPTVTCNSITVALDANGQASILGSDVVNSSSDNCGVATVSVSPMTFDCNDVGNTVNVSVLAYDNSQNVDSCTALVTVIDTTAPTASCVGGLTVSLDANGQAFITANDVDAGSATACGGSVSLAISPSSFDCSNIGQSNIVTLTVTDGQGKTDACTTNVTVNDTTPPSLFCNVNAILNLNGNQVTFDPTTAVSFASDNCGVVDTTASQTIFGCQNAGIANQVVITVSDASANTTTCVVTVLVFDVTAPVAQCAAATVSLDANGNASIAGSDVDRNSTDNCGIVSMSVTPNTFDCNDTGAPVTVTLTVVDGAGLSSSCTSLVTVEDVTPPTAVCQTVTAMLDVNGYAVINESMVDGGSFDNCTVKSLTIDQDSFQCNQFGTNIVTLTVEDNAGLTSTCTANVIIQDSLPPTPACVTSVSVALGPNGQVFVPVSLVDGGSFDNCTLVSVTLSPQNFDCSDVGNNQVTLTAVDASGNTNFCVANVEVQDNIPPQAFCQPATVTLDASGTAVLAASDVDGGSLDLCDLDLIVSPDTFTCADLGVNQVVLIVSDPGGNQDACTANVTVLSPVAMPTATILTPDTTVCSADTFFLKANAPGGLATGQWTVPLGVTVFPNTSSPVISVIGLTANTVEQFIWTATESCFTASDTVNVTVNESPFVLAFETSPITVFGGSDGEATAVVVTSTPIANYNWSDGQMTSVATNLSAGTYTVYVEDINGCISNTDTVTLLNPPATGLNVNVKAMLEGPYNPTSMLMSDNLRVFRYIPSTDPYIGTFTVDTTLFQTTGNDAIVDWVMVRLRDASDSTIIVDSTAGLIQRDGDIVAVDNASPINFVNVSPGDYYIEVVHRNHLAIMSDTSITLPGPAVLVDFFNGTTPAIGINAMNSTASPGKFLMYGGDADGNGLIQSNDIFLEWLPTRGLAGYYDGDMDMNGLVQSNDIFLIWLTNRGFMSQVP